MSFLFHSKHLFWSKLKKIPLFFKYLNCGGSIQFIYFQFVECQKFFDFSNVSPYSRLIPTQRIRYKLYLCQHCGGKTVSFYLTFMKKKKQWKNYGKRNWEGKKSSSFGFSKISRVTFILPVTHFAFFATLFGKDLLFCSFF